MPALLSGKTTLAVKRKSLLTLIYAPIVPSTRLRAPPVTVNPEETP